MQNRIYRLLEQGLNHCIDYDETLRAQLRPLNNRTMALILEGSAWPLYLRIHHDHIIIQHTRPQHLDTIIRGSLNDFLALSEHRLLRRKGHKNSLHFEGDVDMGLKLKQILSQADIDWTQMLSDQVGEAPASLISQIGVAGIKVLSHFADQTKENLREANLDAHWAPTQTQCESFFEDILQLQTRIQHCEARINAFHRTPASSPPPQDT